MRDGPLAIVGTVGTVSTLTLRTFLETYGSVLPVICGTCTLIILLPRVIKTVRAFVSGKLPNE